MLQLIRTSTPEPIKDWLFASRQVASRESMWTYLRLRRLRRRVRNGDLGPPAAASPPVEISLKALRGHAFYVRPGTSDIDSVWNVLIRGREAPPQVVSAPRTILDLGANVGAVMAYAAVRFPSARVVGVEVDPGNADLCRRNIAPWQERCTLIQAAVWADDEEVSYRQWPGSEWSTHVVAAGPSGEDTTGVRGITLDGLVRESELGWVDYMNMDVNIEGSERRLFAGKGKWASRVGCLKVAAHYPADECARDLTRLGFRILRIDRRPITPRVVAVRSRDA